MRWCVQLLLNSRSTGVLIFWLVGVDLAMILRHHVADSGALVQKQEAAVENNEGEDCMWRSVKNVHSGRGGR